MLLLPEAAWPQFYRGRATAWPLHGISLAEGDPMLGETFACNAEPAAKARQEPITVHRIVVTTVAELTPEDAAACGLFGPYELTSELERQAGEVSREDPVILVHFRRRRAL